MNAATRLADPTLLDDAYWGSGDVDAVVTAFVLAATRASVSAGSIGRTESSAMGSLRAWGEKGGATSRIGRDPLSHPCEHVEPARSRDSRGTAPLVQKQHSSDRPGTRAIQNSRA